MRVIAGELGGRRLASPPPGAPVRPTADRVREALFAILGDVSGARVLDLFCGTGALAIEALSRGAADAVMVDRDTALAARNVADLGIEARCELVRGDVRRFLARERRRWDLVLCDPPYDRDRDRGLAGELDRLLPARLAQGARVALESSARAPLTLTLPLEVERRYGEALLRIHHLG